MRTASTLLLKQFFALLALCLLLVQPSYAKERIRYHINGPDGSTLRVVDQKGVSLCAVWTVKNNTYHTIAIKLCV